MLKLRKIISGILCAGMAFLLAFVLTACGGQNASTSTQGENDLQTTANEEDTTEKQVEKLEIKSEDLMANLVKSSPEQTEPVDGFATSLSAFTFNLFKSTLTDNTDRGNKLISPLSAQLCLALIANGASGDTLAEFESIFGVDIDTLNKSMAAYFANKSDDKLVAANSVWLRDDDGLTVQEEYLQTIANYYTAQIYKSAFDSQTVTDINNWCYNNTDGMIQKILEGDISADTMLYLINALKFEAKWAEEYEDYQVFDDIFTDASGQELSVTMLESDENLYISGNGAIGFAKPYKDCNYYFVGLLPEDESADIYEFAESLTGENWQQMWSKMRNATVHARIPEFKTEDQTGLTDILKSMGLNLAFDQSAADFTKMGSYKDNSLYLSNVLQKTYLELDRNGTKAAAVTIGVMDANSAMPPEESYYVWLDRPFVYMIVDGSNGVPVFIGVNETIKAE